MVLKVKKSLIPVHHYNLRIVQCTCIDWCKIPLVPYVFVHCAFSSVSFNSLPEKMLIYKQAGCICFDQKLSKFENSNGSSNCLPYRMQNHTDYISLNVVHYAFSNGSSNVLPEMMRNHIGSIFLTFLHCVFSNKSSKCFHDKKQNHTFAIVCFQNLKFKWVHKLPAWYDA